MYGGSQYILERHTPVPCEDMHVWGSQFGTANRHVADQRIGQSRISTVFLGSDHGYNGKPLLFETMIFGGELDSYQERCSTWKEAELMHSVACKKVRLASLFVKKNRRSWKYRTEKLRIHTKQDNKSVIRGWQRCNNGRLPDISVIPYGPYCYRGSYICPHYSKQQINIANLDEHPGIVAEGQTHIGCCSLLRMTDDDFHGWGALWNEVKECRFNQKKH